MARDNYNQSTRRRIMSMRKGLLVERPAALVLAAITPIFSITGGSVILTGLLGEIEVAIAATATTLRIGSLNTGGTPAQSYLSAVSGDIQSMAPGRMFALPAAVIGALTISTGSSAMEFLGPEHVLTTGNLTLTGSAAPATGTIKWSAWYVPVDEGAYMTAV